MLSSAEVVTYGLLSAAVAALWVPGRRRDDGAPVALPLLLLAAAAGSALWFGYLSLVGLAALTLLAGLSYAFYRPRMPLVGRVATGVAVLLLAAALSLHLVPGFANPKVISAEVLTPGALPYTRYLNFDKTTAGLLLLLLGWRRIATWGRWRDLLRRLVPVALALFAVVLPLALALGHVRFEPVARPHLLLWAWTNLLFTCTAEEALFRGFIQRGLERALASHRFGAGVALVTASSLFGLAHLAGGWTYVLLSTIAGLGYGWALRRSGRIEGAIVVHFLVNALHFGFFTYPALAVQ